MNCDRSRVLIGVYDELDRPTQLALRKHVADCRSCAACWVEEQEFRQLAAAREGVKPRADLTAPLLAIPSLDLRWLRLRLSIGRAARSRMMPIALAAALVGGGLWYADQGGFGWGGTPTGSDVAPAGDPSSYGSPGTSRSAAPRDRAAVPRLVAPGSSADPSASELTGGGDGLQDDRVEPAELGDPSLSAAVDAAQPEQMVLVVVEPGPGVAPGPPAQEAQPAVDPARDGGASRTAAPDVDAPNAPVATEPTPPVAGRSPTLAPTLLPPTSQPSATPLPGARPSSTWPPTAVPTATPLPTAAAEWVLTVTVRADDPGAGPDGELLVTADALATDGRWEPFFETAAAFDGDGEISVVVRQSSHDPPYAVTLFGVDALDGFELCSDSPPWATVTREEFGAGSSAALAFRLCATPEGIDAARSGYAAPPRFHGRPTDAPPVIEPAG